MPVMLRLDLFDRQAGFYYLNEPFYLMRKVAEVGIAPTSHPLQGCANLSQLLGRKDVVPDGNAPPSSGYQPGALLLSYGTKGEETEEVVSLPPPLWVVLMCCAGNLGA